MPLYFFSNHKSGTSFLQKLLTHFVRINYLQLHTHPLGKRVILHPDRKPFSEGDIVFYRNAEYSFIRTLKINGVRVIRNPLSTICSGYFSHLKTHKTDGWDQLIRQREILENMSQDQGMALTLAFMERDDFYPVTAGPLNALSQWNMNDKSFLTARMEDMVLEPTKFLRNALRFSNKDPDSYRYVNEKLLTFKAMTGRKVGKKDISSHLRSGDPNDWRALLPDYIQIYIRSHYKDVLEKYYPESLIDYPPKDIRKRLQRKIQTYKANRLVSRK